MKQKNKQIYMLTSYALITALICIFAPLSVPIGPIPISLTNLVLYFSIYIIGFKGSTVSYTVYLLLGLVGLPVFSGGAGGPAKVVGPTGGYLLGFFFITIFSGLVFDKCKGKYRIPLTIVSMIITTGICYLFGTLWFIQLTDNTFVQALSLCVYPFIPFDLGKIAIATVVGMGVRIPLLKQGIIE